MNCQLAILHRKLYVSRKHGKFLTLNFTNLATINCLNLIPVLILGGGGVGIFVKNGINFNVLKQYSIFSERIIETLFVKISDGSNQKIIIGSVYRPGTKCPGLSFTEQFAQFSDLLSNILSELGAIYDKIYIFGDFNLDLLKINENKFISDYVDTLFSFGFLQIVTKPTRISENSATLIDHILTNSSNDAFESFLLCWQISDHLPLIHNLSFKKTKPKLEKN